MIDVIEITIEEFKDNIYNKYIKLFPEEEQREWKKIEDTYKKGIERFYKITLENKNIGFFMLERLNNNYPFYLDYFAIFDKFQSKGYGTKAIQRLLDKIIIDKGLIAEIEKEDLKNSDTIRRAEFYKRLGFEKVKSEYLLYNVVYEPIIYLDKNKYNKEKIDEIFFDYYKNNCGEEEIKNKCKIIK